MKLYNNKGEQIDEPIFDHHACTCMVNVVTPFTPSSSVRAAPSCKCQRRNAVVKCRNGQVESPACKHI